MGLLSTEADPFKIQSNLFTEGCHHQLGMILPTHDKHAHAYSLCQNNMNITEKSNLVT